MIVGAGLAGLIAAHIFPRHLIAEARPQPHQSHKALLRCRTLAVSEVTGIPFRTVTVRKGLWSAGRWEDPNIHAANAYSRKVLGHVLDRSIWNMDAEVRFIPPENFYEQLLAAMDSRVVWGMAVDFANAGEDVISTAPMPVVMRAVGLEADLTFAHERIYVRRFRIKDCDVHQTVYYPSPEHCMYRASITGDLLTCEFSGPELGPWAEDVEASFGLDVERDLRHFDSGEQAYGKLLPVHNGERQAVIAQLSQAHRIFSLGRFATWRNLLLDDVVHDAHVIKQLMNASQYERKLKAL